MVLEGLKKAGGSIPPLTTAPWCMIASTSVSKTDGSGHEPEGATINKTQNMELKFKKLSEQAVLPVRAHKSDAGLDLTCTRVETGINECGQLMLIYHTDLAVEIPEGYVGLLFPRSSIYKKSIALTNSVGVVDSGYRGEIMCVFKSTTDVVPAIYKQGERFCQLVVVPIPAVEVVEATELSESDRSEAGFGSTGNKNEYSAPDTESTPGSADDAKVSPESAEDVEQITEAAAGDKNTPEQA